MGAHSRLRSSFGALLAACSVVLAGHGSVDAQRLLTKPTTVEAESLQARAKSSAGPVTTQDMRGFGAQWGGGAQLFWRPPAPVDTPMRNWPSLTLPIDTPQAGRYEVTLYLTAAPDYGNVRAFLRGQAVGDFAGFAPSVALRSLSLGQHQLDAGANQLILTVFGKESASSGHLVGVDRIVLVSAAGSTEAPASGGAQALMLSEGVLTPNLGPLPPLRTPQQQLQQFSLTGAGTASTVEKTVTLSAARLMEQGVGYVNVLDAYMVSPPNLIMVKGPEGSLATFVSTTPGQFYLVNFVMSVETFTNDNPLKVFATEVKDAGSDAQLSSQTANVKAGSGWVDVPVGFKAIGTTTSVRLYQTQPVSPVWSVGRVEIANMK